MAYSHRKTCPFKPVMGTACNGDSCMLFNEVMDKCNLACIGIDTVKSDKAQTVSDNT